MKRILALICLVSLLPLSSVAARAQTPSPSFTVSAANITMSSSTAGIPFTITSVNGFTGTVIITCAPPNPPVGVREPSCGGGYVDSVDVPANSPAQGGVGIGAYLPFPAHETSRLAPQHRGETLTFSLAGLLLLGFSLRKKRLHLSLTILLLVALGSMNGCSSGPETLTPGNYTFTITAHTPPPSPSAAPAISVIGTAVVTVPSGIDVLPGPGPI